MALSATAALALQGLGASVLSGSVALSGGNACLVDESIPDSSTDLLLTDVSIDVSQVKALFILSDKALTLEWNDAAGTQGSKVLTANVPVIWYTGCGSAITAVLAADITALYVTNASGAAARLQIQVLTDPTP